VLCLIGRLGLGFLWGLKYHGLKNVPRTGGVILAANHQSLVDPVLVGCALGCGLSREIHFMARKTLFEIPVLGRLIVALNAFPITRDSGDVKGVRTALERLKKGSALLVFPEGTRTLDGRIGQMKAGIRLLAERAAVPIVPVLIVGAYKSWPKGRAWPRLSGRVDVIYGRPIAADALVGDVLREQVVGLESKLPRKTGA